MRIFHINNVVFRGYREDRNYVKRLSEQSAPPISENMECNISDALENLAKNPSDDNIRFLLSTAQGLAYGVQANSEFKKKLLASSPLKGKKLSNTDWELKLKQAAAQALSQNTSPNKKELEERFKTTFNFPFAISPDESNILGLREKILGYKTITESSDTEKVNRVKENLDYFIFSSEISEKEKKECLEKIAHFTSSKYKINPQLKGKKLQVLDEILNDIIIKNPEKEILTIKDVNQKFHGMCGAISVCRKLLAYMDKKNYLENIFEELNASPYMQIYDITRLGSGRKISVEKVNIDFEDALSQGYRIIDASALQWMQNASRTGDGNSVISDYIPFDKSNYQVYADSFWLASFPPETRSVHEMLKSTIKARSFAEQIHREIAHLEVTKGKKAEYQNVLLRNMQKNHSALNSQLQKLFPSKTNNEIQKLSARILSLEKGSEYVNGSNYKRQTGENPDFIINPKEPDSIKKSKILSLLKALSPLNEPESSIDEIFASYDAYISAETEYNKLKNLNPPKKKARLYKLLFKYATAYQDALERNLANYHYSDQCMAMYNLPDRRTTIRNHFSSIIDKLRKAQKTEDLDTISKLLKSPADTSILLPQMQAYADNFERKADLKFDEIIKMFGFKDKKEMTIALINAYIENINTNDKEEIALLSRRYKINPTKFAVLKKLNNLRTEVETGTYKGNIDKILSDFNIKDDVIFIGDLKDSVATLTEHPEATVINPKPLYFFAKNIIAKAGTKTDFSEILPDIENKLAKFEEYILSVEENFNVPAPKEIVLAYYKTKGEVLSADEFEILNKKFLEIARLEELKDSSTNRINISDAYIFSKQETEIINRILKNFSNSEKYVNKLYNAINRTFKKELDKIYNETGRMNGDFWTREEGTSGLYDGQELKILEQMTGRPFHVEHDLLKVIEKIKSGIGGGQINSNVCDDEFSGHAQFLMGVTPVISQKGTPVYGIWHDNSWGRAERKNLWQDENGLFRTDYQNGTGGKDGFIVRENGTTGWDTDYMLYGKGVHKPKLADNPTEGKYYRFTGTEYSLFDSALLPIGITAEKASAIKLAREMINIFPARQRLKSLLRKLDNDEIPNTKIFGENFDKLIQNKTERITQQAMDIKTETDFEKLPEDDPLKIVLKKLAILKTNFGQENKDIIDNISTQKDIVEYNRHLLNKLKLFLGSYLGQNTMLVRSEKIKCALINYLDDFEKINKCNLGLLKSDILKALRIQDNELKQGKSLQTLVQEKITEAVTKDARFNPQKENLLKALLYLFNTYYDDVFSVEKILSDSDFAPILKVLDTKFNPQSDEEAKLLVGTLRKQSREEINKLLNQLTLKDFGIEYQNPYHILKVIQTNNYAVQDKFNSELFTHLAYEFLPKDPDMKVALGNTYDEFKPKYDQSIDALYRSLYVDLSYAEIDGIINRHKDEYLKKYSIRASFPDVKDYDVPQIYEVMDKNLETIKTIISLYQTNLMEEKLLNLTERLKRLDIKTCKTSKEYNEIFSPLIIEICKSNVLGDLGNDCIEILNHLRNDNNKKLEEKLALIQNFQEQLFSIEPSFNKKLLDEMKEKHLKKLKSIIENSAVGFVINPNQKQTLIILLKKYASVLTKNKPLKQITELENKIKEYTAKHCALKNPTLVLNELIKLKLEDKANGTDANQEKIDIYKSLLEEALDSAHKTGVECKILEEINSGRIYDLRKNLEGFKITLTDNSVVDIMSDKGIYALFYELYNPKGISPMSTVNLLCQNTGLADDFSRVLTDKFDTGRFEAFFKAFYERLQKTQQDINLYNQLLNKIISSQPISYSDAIETYKKELQKNFLTNSKTMTSYTDTLNSFSETIKNISNMIYSNNNLTTEKQAKITIRLLEETHQRAINAMLLDFEDKHIKKFNKTSVELENGIEILTNLHISKFSPQKEIHDKTLEVMKLLKVLCLRVTEETQQFMDKTYIEVPEEIKIDI